MGKKFKKQDTAEIRMWRASAENYRDHAREYRRLAAMTTFFEAKRALARLALRADQDAQRVDGWATNAEYAPLYTEPAEESCGFA